MPTAETRLTAGYHVTGAGRGDAPARKSAVTRGSSHRRLPARQSAEASAASFHVGPDDLRYQVDAQVSHVDLQRIGKEFHIQTLTTDRYRSVLNGHVTATVRGSDLDTMELAAAGAVVKSSMFAGEFPEMAFDTTISNGALRVKARGWSTAWISPS